MAPPVVSAAAPGIGTSLVLAHSFDGQVSQPGDDGQIDDSCNSVLHNCYLPSNVIGSISYVLQNWWERALPNLTVSQFKRAFGDKGFSCQPSVELAGQWATACTEGSAVEALASAMRPLTSSTASQGSHRVLRAGDAQERAAVRRRGDPRRSRILALSSAFTSCPPQPASGR